MPEWILCLRAYCGGGGGGSGIALFCFAAIAKIVVNGILAWHTKYSNYDVWERTARARMSHSSRNDDKLCLAWPAHALCNCRYCGMCAYLASDIFDFDCCQCLSLLRFGGGRVATEPTRQRLGSDMFEGRAPAYQPKSITSQNLPSYKSLRGNFPQVQSR